MFVGRLQREDGTERIIAGYSSVKEAADKMACITCKRALPCPLYSLCRAGKGADEKPAMYIRAALRTIDRRLTDVDGDLQIVKTI